MGAGGDGVGGTSGLVQLGLELGPFAVEGLAQGGAGGGAGGGLLPGGEAAVAFGLGAGEGLAGGGEAGGQGPGPAAFDAQLLDCCGEFMGGGLPCGRGGGSQGFAHVGQRALDLGALAVGAPVQGEGGLLGLLVDMAGDLPGGRRVGGGAADGTGLAVGELRGEFGGDVREALLLEGEPVLVRGEGALPGGDRLLLGGPGLRGVLVAAAGSVQLSLFLGELGGEVLGARRRVLRLLDAALQGPAGVVPAVEPGSGLLEDLLVGALLPVVGGALGGELTEAPLGAARGLQSAQLLKCLAGGGSQPHRPGPGEAVGRRGHTSFAAPSNSLMIRPSHPPCPILPATLEGRPTGSRRHRKAGAKRPPCAVSCRSS